jgi:hypothetical protein
LEGEIDDRAIIVHRVIATKGPDGVEDSLERCFSPVQQASRRLSPKSSPAEF